MYKVVGVDSREYGPVTREAILEWIAQGRANGETIARFEDGAWKPLSTFDEFKPALGSTAPPPPGSQTPLIQTTFVAPGSEAPPFSGVGSQRVTNVPSVLGIVFPIVCCCCAYVGPIMGLVFSAIGLSQIKANPNKYSTSDALPKIGIGISIGILILHIIGSVLDFSVNKLIQKGGFNF
jgi:hypothetical protein